MDENNINRTSVEESQQLTLRDLWSMCIHRWPWFLVSVALCLFAAVIYILKTPPVYTRSAQVLIKEDRRGRSISAADVQSSISDLGLVNTNVNVNNEILNISSPDMMIEVVKRLHLEVDYKMAHRLYDRTLYGSSLPLVVEFLDLGNGESASFDINSAADSVSYVFSKFKRNKEELKDAVAVVAALGDTLSTPLGRVVLSAPSNQEIKPLESTLHVYRSSYNAATRAFSKNLNVDLANKQATVINMSLNDVNVQRAEDVLNMLINVYNEKWIKDKNQIATSTNEFIAERLLVIQDELGDVDQTISTFKSANRLPDIGAVASMEMQVSREASREIMALNNQLSIARYLQSYIRDSRGRLLPADAGLQEASIQSMINEFNATLLQRNRLVESSSEENYLVRDLDNQLAGYREAILSSIDNYIVGVNMQLSAYRSTQAAADARISSNPQQAGRLLSDERQQKVKESLYLFLLQKREENELSQAFTAYNTRVLMAPTGSNAPIAPRRSMILLIAFVMGLAIPFGLLYIREITNTTVRGREDLKGMAAPFVGELPSIVKKKRFDVKKHIPFLKNKVQDRERKFVVKAHNRDMINEAFRVVRTNLEFMRGKGKGGYVIMLTSMNPGSGKTFISSNLSSCFAIKGKKTIVIDLDLRKKSLSEMIGKPKRGISDYLNGREDDYESLIIHNVNECDLDLLPVGTLPPNPAELLADERLDNLMHTLRGKYDYIFLDCPPVEIVTDADIINRLVDLTLFVTRAGILERSMLTEIDRYYNTKKYVNLAVVLNGTDSAGHYGYKYGYRYGYGYGHYGYGYGYGNYGSEHDAEIEEGEKAAEAKHESKKS